MSNALYTLTTSDGLHVELSRKEARLFLRSGKYLPRSCSVRGVRAWVYLGATLRMFTRLAPGVGS